MRIVGGNFRGRRLAAPRGRDVRPTGDKVREAVFSILGDVHGCSVLDLFAGTGALGLEALSRGAHRATFVEIDRQACEVIRRNIDATISSEHTYADLVKGDAVRIVRTLAMGDERFDLVFFDPPYEQTERMLEQVGEALLKVVSPRSRVVLETSIRHQNLHERATELWQAELVMARAYGDTAIAVLRPTPVATLEFEDEPDAETGDEAGSALRAELAADPHSDPHSDAAGNGKADLA